MDPRTYLDQIMRGYQSPVILLTAAHVGLFVALGRECRQTAELAAALNLDERALDLVLRALVADEFLDMEGSGYRLRPELAPYLLPDSDRTQASMTNHHYNCLQRWVQLAEVLRTGKPAPRAQEQRTERELRDFICAMENISRESSLEVASKVDFSTSQHLLDLGGGPGTAALAFAKRFPQLHCVVFDLEGPLVIASEEIAKAELADRVTTQVGDYLEDELGHNFDVIYISNIIHSLSPESTALIFQKCHRALQADGRLIVKDFFLDDARIQPSSGARFSINMLVSTEGGRSYSYTETEALLADTGFGDFERQDVATHSGLLTARKIVG